jgi:tetratricopeptide (TPR) repeat protein/predicted Ser/Thr protein kinase
VEEDPDSTLIGEQGSQRPVDSSTAELERGATLGRYVVLALLGRGGMGVVYAAFDPQLDRKVALKVLHGAGSSSTEGDGSPRLLREAQALAKLAHPNVISVHDVGTVGAAVFIAMEYVSGQTFAQWNASERPWSERVAMLVAAGNGIAAAHRRGIVHRDFKPDNVMIGGDERPRVLDFGLARAADAELGLGRTHVRIEPSHELPIATESTLDAKLTVTGAVMGTPAYMAPEQHLGGVVDERSDQFSFCVTVYEAVYGERPFRGDSLAALAFQVCQGNVREPPKGSAVPSWLRAVLVRGLSVNPDDRYPHMDDLLGELGRDPARGRRRVLVGLGAALAITGLGLLGQRLLATPQLCTGAADHLVGVWDSDAREAVHAAFIASEAVYAADAYRGVSEVLDAYAGQWESMHTQTCAATRITGEQSDEVLTLRMACLDRSLGELRSLTEVFRSADAATVERGLEAAASLPPLRLCADAETLRSGVRPPDTEALREQVDRLRPRLDRARAQLKAGQLVEARGLLDELQPEVAATGYRPLIAETELAHGQTLEGVEAKLAALQRAVWMAQAGRHDRVAAEAWTVLAMASAQYASDYPAALAAIAQADAAIERIGGDDELRIRLDVAHGVVLHAAGRPDEALVPHRRAHAARAAAGQAGSPQALFELVSFANALSDGDDGQDPADLLTEGLALARVELGDDHPWVARLQTTLARSFYGRGEYEAAEHALRDALVVFERAYGEDSGPVSSVLNGLALVLHSRGEPEQALEVYTRALTYARRHLAPRHGNIGKVLHNIGNVERELGQFDASLAHLEEAREIIEAGYGPGHVDVAELTDNIADTQRAMGQLEQAIASYDQSIATFTALGADHRHHSIYPLTGRAQAERALGQAEQARASFELAQTIITEFRDEVSGEWIARHGLEFAKLLWDEGEHARARSVAMGAMTADASIKSTIKPVQLVEIRAWLEAHPPP